MRRGLRWHWLWLVALAACTPYDPSLPPTPFLCGDQEPRCPEGYTCVTDRNDKMVCLADSLAHDAGVPDAAVAGKITDKVTETITDGVTETITETITDPVRSAAGAR